MKIIRTVIGVAAVLLIHFVFLNQTELLGRVIIFESPALYIFYVSVLVLSFLSGFDRTRKLSFLVIPFTVIFGLELLLSSLTTLNPEVFSTPYAVFNLAEIPLAILIFAISISLIQFSDKLRVQATISFTSLLVAAVIAYILIDILSPFLPKEVKGSDLAFIIIAFISVLALTALSNVSEKTAFLRNQRGFLLGIVLAIGIYITFIKPLIGERVGIANFIEWAIVTLATLKVARSVPRSIEVEKGSMIEVHRKSEKVVKDDIQSEIERAEAIFLERGEKVPLIVALSRHLGNAGVSNQLISECITPLIQHEDDRTPLFAFPWEKKLIELKNKRKRAKIIESVRKKLSKGGADFERRTKQY
jgi:hypothetical protein